MTSAHTWNEFLDEQAERLRRQRVALDTYSEGDRVVLIWTADADTQLQPGTRGTVRFVDDTGTVHIAWDTGSRLGMCLDAGDEIRHLTDAELEAERAGRRV